MADEAQSDAFRRADQFTAAHEGGKTHNDGTGHAAAYGIDQTAHPNIDVMSLSPEQAMSIRKREYWDAINGDHLAQINPYLAQVAYDTAIMSGPGKAIEFLHQSGGDPKNFLQQRVAFQTGLVQSNPEKYGGAAKAWEARNEALGHIAGWGPQIASMQAPGDVSRETVAPVQAPEEPKPEEKPPEPEAAALSAAAVPPLQPAKPLAPAQPGQGLTASTRDRYLELLKQPPQGTA